MRRYLSVTHVCLTFLVVLITSGIAVAQEQRSYAKYVESHPQLRIIGQDTDPVAYCAAEALKLGINLGLGTCSTGDVLSPKLYILHYARVP
jgi:hypothetical protein